MYNNQVKQKQNNIRWAIIGAGPAGVLASTRLKKQGHEVTLFDQNDRVGGNAQSVKLRTKDMPDRHSDLAVKFLPPCGWEERILEHSIVQELEEYGAKLKPVGRSTFFRGGQPELLPIPLNPFKKIQLAKELLRTFDVFYEASKLKSPEELYSHGYVLSGENIFEWGKRMKAPLLTKLMTHVYEILGLRHYGFGDGILDHSAGYVLGLRCRYLPGTYRKVFHKSKGLRKIVKGIVSSGIFKMKNKKAFLRFLELEFPESEMQSDWSILPMSFGELFPKMVKDKKVNLRLGYPVTDITILPEGKISLACGTYIEVFDRVLICTPVPYLSRILDTKLQESFSMLLCPIRNTQVSVSVSKGSIQKANLADQNTLVFSSKHLQKLGTKSFTPSLMGYINEPGAYVMAQSYTKVSDSDEDIKQKHFEDLSDMGASTTPPAMVRNFDWPYVPTIKMIEDGFFDKLSAVQGKQNIAICNETTCGLGLLNLSNGVDRIISILD